MELWECLDGLVRLAAQAGGLVEYDMVMSKALSQLVFVLKRGVCWKELSESPAGLEVAAGLVESLAKCGLQLATRRTGGAAAQTAAHFIAEALRAAAPFIHDVGAHLRAKAQDSEWALRATALRCAVCQL